MRIAAAALLLFACASAPSSPQRAVSDFYRAFIAHPSPGLPEGKDLARLRPMLSDRLYTLITSALQYSDEVAKAHPGDKPPFVDGDPFTSNFEGPQSFAITRVDGNDVHVTFTYEGGQWEDVVVVKEERGRYVIDDVRYGGAGEFNPPGLLSEHLQSRE